MNRHYRSIWNEVSRTFVAVAEKVHAKGKPASGPSSQAAGAEQAVAAAAVPARTLVMPRALEQRFMFDAAAVSTAIDAVTDHVVGDVQADSGLSAALDKVVQAVALQQEASRVQEPVLVRAGDAAADGGRKEVAFVDSRVADYQTLVAGIGAGIEVRLIEGSQDGLAQLAAWAASHSGYDAIHILSHGSNGDLVLGSSVFDRNALLARTTDLVNIGKSLTADGDILLYGCGLASDESGVSFIQALASLTGADVAASIDATGADTLGGNWALEAKVGDVTAQIVTVDAYEKLLTNNVITMTGTTNVVLSNGTVDLLYFGATFYNGGGNWLPNSLSISGVPVISGFNANEDFVDLRDTAISASATFDTNFADSQAAPVVGSDYYYTSYGYGSANGQQFSISGNTLTTGSGVTGFLVGYTDENNGMPVYAFFKDITGTLTLSNFLLPGSPDPGPSNGNPTIADVSNQTLSEGGATSALAVTIGDTETAASALTLTGSSSNTTLIPNGNIVISGSGANRTVTITPAANQTGTATITLTVDDGNGGTATDTFTVTVNDVDPVISNATVSLDENTASGTTVTTVTTSGDTDGLAYSITGGTGSSLFDINSSTGVITVKSGAVLDYETASQYTLTLAVDDEDAGSTADSTATITINLNDLNEAPTDISLSSSTLGLSQMAANATIGSLSATDQDSGASQSYSLVAGSGDTYNGSFVIVGNTLKVGSNALAAGTYQVRVQATDNGGLSYQKALTVTVSDDIAPTLDAANSTPADDALQIAPSANIVLLFSESLQAGTGTLVLRNLTTNQVVETFNIATGTGTAGGTVSISGNTVTLNPGSNLAEATRYSVRIDGTALRDTAANAFAGISDDSSFNFTTGVSDSAAPLIQSIQRQTPAGEATNAASLVYTVHFNEAVAAADVNDFVLTSTGTASGTISSVSGSGTDTLTVTVTGVSGTGTLGLSLGNSQNITDIAGNALATAEPADDEVYTVDRDVPTLVSINRVGDEQSQGGSLQFLVVFSEPVSSVDAADFALLLGGTASGTISSISGTGTPVLTVTVSNAAGSGSLGLGLANGYSISDAAGNALASATPGTGVAEGYVIDSIAPTVTSITRTADSLTTADSVSFDVSFSEGVNNVDLSDFSLTTSGSVAGTISAISGSNGHYRVTVSGISGSGTLGLAFAGNQDVADDSGNVLTATTPTLDETYTIDNTAPTVSAINRAGVNQIVAGTSTDAVFTVVFSEVVSGVSAADLTVTGTAANTGISSVSSSDGKTFHVTVGGVNGSSGQTVGLNFSGTVSDRVSQTGSTAFNAGQVYTVGNLLLNEGAIDQAALDALLGVNRDGVQKLVSISTTVTQVIIIDSRLPGLAQQLSNLAAGTEVWLLDGTSSATAQITQILAQYHNLAAVHLLSHGSEGALHLGAETLSAANLATRHAALAGWGAALSANGDFLLYGCDVAKGTTGTEFINAFAAATQADVAASTDLTGASWLGGDWVLESSVGTVDVAALAGGQAEQFDSVMGTPIVWETHGSWTQWKAIPNYLYVRAAGGASQIWQLPANQYFEYYTAISPAKGYFQVSTNGGSSWSTLGMGGAAAPGSLVRFVHTGTASDTQLQTFTRTYTNPSDKDNSGYYSSILYITLDTPPTDISTSSSVVLNDAVQGNAIAVLTPTDSGPTTRGHWSIIGQSVSNLVTISYDSSTGNIAQLLIGSGILPAVGQTFDVTVRYCDELQTDISGNPLTGEGYTKTFTFTVVQEEVSRTGYTTDLILNTTSTNAQQKPDIAKLSNGNYVATWQSVGQGDTAGSIIARIFDQYGNALGAELQISATNTLDDAFASVAALDNGRFVVTYQAYDSVAGTANVMYRVVEANGTLGAETVVNTTTGLVDYAPAISRMSDGGFVVVWLSSDSGDSILFRRFDSAGTAIDATSQTVATQTYLGWVAGTQLPYSVTALDNGKFVLSWQDVGNTAFLKTVLFDGTSLGAVTSITNSNGGQSVDVAQLADGSYVIAYDNWVSGETFNVETRQFDASGNEIAGRHAIVGSYSSPAVYGVSIATLGNGGYMVGWSDVGDDVDGYGSFGRRFNADGTAIDNAALQLNAHRRGDQYNVALAENGTDGFIAVWTDTSADGVFNSGIEGRFIEITNATPTISDVSNQTINEGGATSALAVTIGDTETAASALTLTGSSSNTTLIPNGNIVISGSGANRTVTITPATNQTGTATITLTVDDGNGGTATDTFTVTVNDVDPVISNATVSLDENTASGTTVTTVTASGDTDGLVYSITGGSGSSLFDINSSTGMITVKNGAVLDYETASQYTLTVAVDDEDAGSSADSTATITINLNDLNEAPTNIALSVATFANTQAGAGATLTTISGTDPDSAAPNNTLSYSLVSGSGDTDNASFVVDGTSLKVASGSGLAAGSYSLRLRVTDGGSLSYEKAFSITVIDPVPTLVVANPLDNSTGVPVSSNIVLNFSEAISLGSGNIVLYDITGNGANSVTIDVSNHAGQLSINGGVLTINPSADLLAANQYALKIDSTALRDSTSQAYAGIADNTTLNFTTGTTDTQAPIATIIDLADPSSTNAGTASIRFSEQVQNVDISDFTLTRDGQSVDISSLSVGGSGASYTLDLSSVTTVAGSYVLTVNTSNITDTSGNALAAAVSDSFVIDKNAPTAAAIVRASATPTNSGSLNFTVVFTEAVSGVDSSDFTLSGTASSGASIASVTCVSDSVYTVAVTGASGNGTLGLDLKSSGTGIADLAGNAISGGATGQLYTLDNTAPSVVGISRTGAQYTSGGSVSFTVTFDSNVSGVSAGDFTLSKGNGVVASDNDITVSGSGSSYTVTVANVSGNGLLGLQLKSSGTGISDRAGNAISAGFSSSAEYVVDQTSPVVIASQTFTLPENMASGFVIGQVLASDANRISGYQITAGDSAGYFSIDADGVITLTAAGAADGAASRDYEATPNSFSLTVLATDVAGNSYSQVVTISVLDAQEDSTPPTATITLSDTALRIGETATVTITFSEAVTGFSNADLTIANGTLSAVSSSDGGITWTATFTPSANISDASNVITLDNSGVADLFGNSGTGTTDSGNYSIDTARPTLTDISVSDSALKVGDTATVTFTFSEAVSGFTTADVTVPNGTLSNLSSSDGGITWTATLTPSANISDASNALTVDLTGVADAAGNAGSGTTDSGNIAIDTARPTLSVSLSTDTLLPNQTAVVTFTFSEPPLDFGLEDVQASGGTLSDLRQGDSPNIWLATFTPTPGIVTTGNAISVLGGWTDLAGNSQLGDVQSDSYVVNTFVQISQPEDTPVDTAASTPTVVVTTPATVDSDGAAFVQSEAVAQLTSALSPAIAQLAQLLPTQADANAQQAATPADLVLTQSRAGAFQVLVLPRTGGDDTLSVNNPVRDQEVQQGGGEQQIALPADLFAHTDPNETVVLLATQVDGQPLPAWVQFDPLTGKLVVDADKAPAGEVVVKVIARDSQNREAITTFKLVVGDKRAQLERKGIEGKPNLTAQLQLASRAQQQGIVEKITSGLGRLVKLS